MAEYIEREALPQKKERGFFLDDDFNAGWNACLNKISAISPADVRENTHGKWVKHKDEIAEAWGIIGYKCSICGRVSARTNFCPNCGADMREE